ncbi:MAG: YnbE family lipoprotein [Desulfatitalea sp.]|nr:YnbE family lipoprotein [Desulfatitalea sp.]
MKKKILWPPLMLTLLVWGFGCQTQHKIESVHKIEVAPMHITIDVNVRVDRALDDFFSDLDETE